MHFYPLNSEGILPNPIWRLQRTLYAAWDSAAGRAFSSAWEWGKSMELSPKERVVYGFAVRGFTMRYIAAKLSLSPRTVEAHIRHIYEKTGAGSRDELIEYSEQHL